MAEFSGKVVIVSGAASGISRVIATRFADAVVVPTHAAAARVAKLGSFGDRVRVISPRPGIPEYVWVQAIEAAAIPTACRMACGAL